MNTESDRAVYCFGNYCVSHMDERGDRASHILPTERSQRIAITELGRAGNNMTERQVTLLGSISLLCAASETLQVLLKCTGNNNLMVL